MRLYLVQHAEAVDKAENPDRPLSEKGKSDANRMAVFLRQAGVSVEALFHSGKLRAAQTSDRLRHAIAPGAIPIAKDELGPNDDPAPLARSSLTWDRDTMLVGHQPYMGKLVSFLTTRKESSLLTQFTPGTVICLERTKDFHWELVWMVKPELLI